jgi:4-hydroxybenzoate polyprenyltransferase
VPPHRPAWRAYLLLSRVSNLPTVWTNVLVGAVASHAAAPPVRVTVYLALAISLVYTGGMFLNDAFDAAFDATHRPDRPIPAGDVSAGTAYTIGFALLAGGLGIVVSQPNGRLAVAWAVGLAVAVVYYDYSHKRNPLGPFVMGICRGLVYCVAAAAVAGLVSSIVLAAAAVLTTYVLALTWIAKRLGPKAGVVIPILIAGISVLDGLLIVLFGGGPLLALVAVGCAVLTLLLQRVVPGT